MTKQEPAQVEGVASSSAGRQIEYASYATINKNIDGHIALTPELTCQLRHCIGNYL